MEKTFTQIIRTNRLSDGEILLNNKKELDEDKKKILIRPTFKHRTTKRKQVFEKKIFYIYLIIIPKSKYIKKDLKYLKIQKEQ